MHFNNRGVAFLKRKQFEKALEDFDRAISLNANSSSAYHNRGMALSGQGRNEKAIQEFSKVIEMNPDSALLYKDRGLAYMKLGDYEAALQDFQKAIELDKNFAAGYGALGRLHAMAPAAPIQNPSLALRNAEKAVAITKGSGPDMLENLAQVQKALNRTEEAVRTLQKAMTIDPANREYADLLAKWQGVKDMPTSAGSQTVTGRSPFTSLW